ncbi:hypothetical protein [Streptomyces sp. NPDC008125]|uniref:hypothetical protein n=1 Tax=Streptomyces sp. NPDC008125 TaxID=3364811 RepID=UPI0036DFAB69
MLWHAISPVSDTDGRSKALVRSRRMNSDAKIILLYVEGLPADQLVGLMGPLWDYASAAGVEAGPYKKAKKYLQREGHLHQWPYQFGPGRWATAQILSNAPITPQEAKAVWASREQETVWSGEGPWDGPGGGTGIGSHRGPGRRSSWGHAREAVRWEGASPQVAPSEVSPAVGLRGGRQSGGYPPDGQLMARSSHLPTSVGAVSNTERVAFGDRFEWGPPLVDESDSGFWTESPEWLVEHDAARAWETSPDSVPAAVPASVAVLAPAPAPAPAPALVPAVVPGTATAPLMAVALGPESGPAPERVPVPVPVAVPVATDATHATDDAGEELGKGWTPQMVLAEEVLLSLGKESRQLRLGVYEARRLVDKAAEWLRRGMSAADMRYVLSSQLPKDGVRTAVGFLRHRLEEKMPPEPGRRRAVTAVEPGASRPRGVDRIGDVNRTGTERIGTDRTWSLELSGEVVARVPLVECEGPGDVHMFRAYQGHVKCEACRQEEAFQLWAAKRAADARARGEVLTGDGRGGWRDRLAELAAALEDGEAQASAEADRVADRMADRVADRMADRVAAAAPEPRE